MNAPQPKPYDYFEALARLQHDKQMAPEEKERLKEQVALNASDPEAVSLVADIDGEGWINIYPPQEKPETISTARAIDTFLEAYGNTSPAEEALLERLIFNPVPEYGTVLAEKEEKTEEKASSLASLAASINAPKTVAETAAESPAVTPAKKEPTGSLSFELAKIFIKQGHFERAHDIISKIILNNPEKSVYFADQMRFLEKLIRLKNASNKNNQKKTK